MNARLLFLAPWLMALASTAPAEQKTVYRCGATYQDSPCANGRAVDVADERSPEQREAAHAAVKMERSLGSTLERDRVARERRQLPAMAASLGAKPSAVPHHPATPAMKPKRAKKPAGDESTKTTLRPHPPPTSPKPERPAPG